MLATFFNNTKCSRMLHVTLTRKLEIKMADVSVGDEGGVDIRETDLNGDAIPGAIGASASSRLSFDDDEVGKFPQMEEMLKVATDLQGGANVDDPSNTGQSPRLEFEEAGTKMLQENLTADYIRL